LRKQNKSPPSYPPSTTKSKTTSPSTKPSRKWPWHYTNTGLVDFGPFQDGEFVESELGLIPKGWEVKRLDEIITVKRGGSPRPIQDFLAPDGLPWVKTIRCNSFEFSIFNGN